MNVTLRGDEQIYVMPTSWRDAPWWTDAQIDNLRSILDTLKRTLQRRREPRGAERRVRRRDGGATTSRCATRRRTRASSR